MTDTTNTSAAHAAALAMRDAAAALARRRPLYDGASGEPADEDLAQAIEDLPLPDADTTDWKAEAERLTAERDAALAELERVQAHGWPSTPEDVRALLGSRCGAVRYALPVQDGAFEAPPHESDIYTVSAHDMITCNIAASGMRYVSDVALERAQAELAQAREVLSRLEWDSWGYDPYAEGRSHCPCCGWTKDEGHAPDCALSAALAAKGE